jgi:hypothetical protein
MCVCGGAFRIVVPVTQRHDPGMDLPTYMRLPVSQYVLIEVPLGGALSRISEDMFDVEVAPVRFFDLWVQPRVRCRVRQVPNLIVLFPCHFMHPSSFFCVILSQLLCV